MYKNIHQVLLHSSNGDLADLKRATLETIQDIPAYFRVIKRAKSPDTQQTARIIYLLLSCKIAEANGLSVGHAMAEAGVKERNIIQIQRAGSQGLTYLKRQLRRCESVDLDSIGNLAKYWGDNAKRTLLKEFIFNQDEKQES